MVLDDKVLEQLIERAQKKDYNKFELIRSADEYFARRKQCKALKYAAIGFNEAAVDMYNTYLDLIDKGEDTFEVLLAYTELVRCFKFYLKDHEIVKDMLKEYMCYTRDGRIIKNFLLNFYRPDEHMTD